MITEIEGGAVAETIEPRCSGTTKAGVPCNSDILHQDENGVWWCWNHDLDPQVAAERESGRVRGGMTTARKWHKAPRYLDERDLGDLKTPADAQRIAALVTMAVATGRLSSAAGGVVLKSLDSFLRSHEQTELEARFTELESRFGRRTR